MVAKLSKCLPDLLIYFKESPTWESLCYLSSYMPSNKVPSLSSLCYFTLQTLPEDAKPEEFMTALESLCNQNACQELLELIQEWIDYGVININASSPASKRRRSSKKIIESNKIGGKPKPYLATHMLSFMLDHRVCQNTMLHGCEHMLIKMLSSIDLIKVKVEQMNKTSCNEKNSDFLRENIFNFVKISALLYHNNVEDGNKFIEDLISWCSGTLLKHLNSNCNIEAQYNGRKRKSKKSLSPEDAVSQLAVNICKDILTMCSDLIALGLFDTSKCSALLLSAKLLKLGVPSAFILPISKLLNKHLFHSIILFAEISDTTLANKVPPFFCEIIHSLAKEKCVESLPSGETREIQLILSNIVQTVYEGNMYKNEYSGLISSVAENMLDNFVKCSKVIVEKKNCEPFKDILIPTAGGFFFGIMVMRPKMMPLYAKALYKFFNNSEIKIENFVAYCIILCNIAEMKNVSSKTCNHINCLLKSMKVTLNSIYPPRENETDVENCTDDESAVVNTPSKKESFRNHCRTEFAKLQRLFIYKNRTANTIIDGA